MFSIFDLFFLCLEKNVNVNVNRETKSVRNSFFTLVTNGSSHHWIQNQTRELTERKVSYLKPSNGMLLPALI